MTSSKIFGLFVVALALTACSTESRKGRGVTLGKDADFVQADGTNFRIDALRVSSSAPVDFNAFNLPTAKQFNFSMCVKDQMGSSLIADIPFRIKDGRGGEIIEKTNKAGCLTWPETFRYQHLANETYFKLSREVTPLARYRGAVTVEVAFNPWLDGGAAITDLRTDELPPQARLEDIGPLGLRGGQILASSTPVRNVEMALDSLSFEFLGLDYDNYEITPTLGLKVAHKYTLRIKPSVIRRSISKIVVPETLTGGKFRVSMAIFRETKEAAEQYKATNLVSSGAFVLPYSRSTGNFLADISLKFNNIAELTSRTIAVVTVEPIDALEGFTEMHFVGRLKPGKVSGLTLSPGTVDARRILAEQNRIETQASKPVDLFVEMTGVQPLNLAPVVIPGGLFSRERHIDVAGLVKAHFAKDLAGQQKADLLLALCEKIYGKDDRSNPLASEARSCVRNPASSIDFARREFVNRILGAPVKLAQLPVETMRWSVGLSHTLSHNNTAGMSGKTGFGFGLPFQPLWEAIGLKFSFGGETFVSISKTAASNWNRSTNVSSDMSVTSEGILFRYDAEATSCVYAAPTKAVGARIEQRTKKALPGVYACSDKVEVRKNLQETYFLLGQNVGVGGSPYSDSDSNSEVTWRMMIRGKGTKMLLYKVLDDMSLLYNEQGLTLELTRMDEPTLTDKFKEFYMMQEYPGMISQ